MVMKTPSFWYKDSADWRAQALAAPSALYALGHAIHMATARPKTVPVPVICIGNITAGGAGKTPIARAVMRLVQERELASNPAFLTRGYGGTQSGPVIVDAAVHYADTVGDESLLLSRDGTTILSRNRYDGAQFAVANGFNMIVMDDGLHNTSLHRDLNILVIDGIHGIGNGLMIPAGPLRTPLHDGLNRADIIIIIGNDRTNIAARIPSGKPVIHARLAADATPQHGVHYHGFCGLGLPDKFKGTLHESGYQLTGFTAFPDHHPYTPDDLNHLTQMAGNARLITTEKDAVRLPADFIARHNVEILPVSIRMNDNDADRLATAIGTIQK
jgi:tetraacyldisaccharide 4'-kinase